jgi:hypothetical protein
MVVDMGIFAFMAMRYKYVEMPKEEDEEEEEEENKNKEIPLKERKSSERNGSVNKAFSGD